MLKDIFEEWRTIPLMDKVRCSAPYRKSPQDEEREGKPQLEVLYRTFKDFRDKKKIPKACRVKDQISYKRIRSRLTYFLQQQCSV